MIRLRFECGSWNSNLKWFLFKVCMKNFGHSNVKFAKLIFIENNSCEYTKCQFMKGHDRSVVKFVVKPIQQQVNISSLIEFLLWFVWLDFSPKRICLEKIYNFWIDMELGLQKLGIIIKKGCLISKLAKMPFMKFVP